MLLSRIYLNMERWQEAADLAHAARTNSDAQLMSLSEIATDGLYNIKHSNRTIN